jgi:hypothetical protein
MPVAAVAPAAYAPQSVPVIDDLATVRTPTLTPEEVYAPAPAEAAPSPWSAPASAAPATAVASAAPAMAVSAPPASLAPEPTPVGAAASAAAPASTPAPARVAAVEPPPAKAPERAPEEAPPATRKRSTSAPPSAGGKRKPADQARKANKGKFRETLWFKKGDLDAAAAAEAARSKDGAAQDKADSLPIEERYTDDGSVTSGDAERYSLKTGMTSSMPSFEGTDEAAPGGPPVAEDELIGEMKKGRTKILIAIGVGAAAIAAIIAAFAL